MYRVCYPITHVFGCRLRVEVGYLLGTMEGRGDVRVEAEKHHDNLRDCGAS
jgi:hypothetical protein